MNILITGGSGFIGRHLTKSFTETDDHVYILSRSRHASTGNVHFIEWLHGESPLPELGDVPFDAVINLAGANLATGRWTEKRKKEIVDSRIEASAALLALVSKMAKKPPVWINASAIGAYPSSYSALYSDLTETENPQSSSFLGRTVAEWEKTVQPAENFGIRMVYARFGLILGRDGGAFPLFKTIFNKRLGGTFGQGKQWYSWIHINDLVRAIRFVIEDTELDHVIHFTAPHPLQEKQFAKKLGKKLHRPYRLWIPELAIKTALGEKSVSILDSQRVYPEKLLAEHFEFRFDTLDAALDDLIN
ncbi:hypothetical protein MFLO_11070 [Listeria floridensis FSL S10-1187]|uniref:TIGR01777 family protein n=1 Tax=Listeria floridensis FSL S10-1187 TaxID=1265817 RepID=A0ABP3AXG6_9LIST|nr:TIGR01777 family oxidoreductase [Listeria floridensis]EUJ29125.1 hypothetical protein MFLO_11070 [Listeria floridensis FSL S10-1187]